MSSRFSVFVSILLQNKYVKRVELSIAWVLQKVYVL